MTDPVLQRHRKNISLNGVSVMELLMVSVSHGKIVIITWTVGIARDTNIYLDSYLTEVSLKFITEYQYGNGSS